MVKRELQAQMLTSLSPKDKMRMYYSENSKEINQEQLEYIFYVYMPESSRGTIFIKRTTATSTVIWEICPWWNWFTSLKMI